MSKLDFDELYKLYPRKLGKKKGLQKCKSNIKSKKQYLCLRQAILNYLALTKGEDVKFIKHFSTFMACWEDYVDVSSEPTQEIGSKIDWSQI